MAQIDIDANFTGAKTVEELAGLLESFAQKLFAKLQAQPTFHLDTDPSTPLPTNLPPNTIVFQLTNQNTLRLGLWDGDNLNTSQ